MIRFSTVMSVAAALACSAFLSVPSFVTAQSGTKSELAQQGDYSYKSPWTSTQLEPPTAGAAPTTGDYYGRDPAGTAELDRLPAATTTSSTPAARVGLLSDVAFGYPQVVTENNQTANTLAMGQTRTSHWNAAGTPTVVPPVSGGAAFVGQPACGPEGCGSAALGQFGNVGVQEGTYTGLYFAYDAMYTSISAPDVSAIGSADAAGVYTTNGLPNPFYNSFTTDLIDSDFEYGHRLEFGVLNDCGGWLASVLLFDQDKGASAAGGQIQFSDPLGMLLGYQDGDGDGIDDDRNGNKVHGRNGEDLGIPNPLFNPPVNNDPFMPDGMGGLRYDGIPDTTAPIDFGDLVTWVPVFDTLTVFNRTDIDGFQLVYAKPHQGCRPCSSGSVARYGIRVMDLDDLYILNASGSFFDAVNIHSDISNTIVGPSLGFNLCRRLGPWRFEGLLDATFGVNFMRGEQVSEIATNATMNQQSANSPVNLSPSAASSVKESEEFAPIIEWRVGVAYNLSRLLALRFGYTGMYVDGISRAGSATEYTLPSFGLGLDGDDHLNFNAITFGLDLYR